MDEKIDRDIPNLKTTKKKNSVSKLILTGGLLAGIALFGVMGVLFIKKVEATKENSVAENEKKRPAETAPLLKDFETTKLRIKAEEAESRLQADSQMPAPTGAIGVMLDTANTRQGSNTGNTRTLANSQQDSENEPPVVTPEHRRLSGNVLVSFSSDLGQGNNSGSSGGIVNAMLGTNVSSPPKDGFDDKLKPSALLAGQALQRPDLRYLMRRGTSIQCGQKTKIVTDHPGMVSCQVSKDVYSANGDVLLIERGSDVFGEQRSAVMQGQASIEVLWSRIDTPTGVAIDINSLATDSLGASGIPAEIDNHVMKRFGGAVMLSLIGDVGQAFVNKASSANSPIQLTNTAGAGQDLASKTLENTINIPPTATSLQGSAINIFVARDMDFRTVYELARY